MKTCLALLYLLLSWQMLTAQAADPETPQRSEHTTWRENNVRVASNVESTGLPTFTVPQEFRTTLKEYRKSWTRLSNLQFSGLHWNQSVVVYTNKNPEIYRSNYAIYQKYASGDAEEVDKLQFASYPIGTILLKENYVSSDNVVSAPASIALMIKREKNYDATTGDWQFVQFNASGRVLANGSSKDATVATACTQCHQSMAPRDYVFTHFYDAVVAR